MNSNSKEADIMQFGPDTDTLVLGYGQAGIDQPFHTNEEQDDKIEDEDEDESFNVHDVLIWSSKDQHKPADVPLSRSTNLYVNHVKLLWAVCFVTVVVCAEAMIRKDLEAWGAKFCIALQRTLGPQFIWLFDKGLSFKPTVWGLIPGVAAATVVSKPRIRCMGERIILLHAFGKMIRWVLKVSFHANRPFWLNEDVEIWHCTKSYGFPSGHSLLLLLGLSPWFWFLRSQTNQPLFSLLGVCLYIVYGCTLFGRIYLGAHFPHDMLMGISAAVLLLVVVSPHNIKVIASRVRHLSGRQGNEPMARSIARVFLHSCATALFLATLLLCISHTVQLFDSSETNTSFARILKVCGKIPKPTSEVGEAMGGVGLFAGWIAATAITAEEPPRPSSPKLHPTYGSLPLESSELDELLPVAGSRWREVAQGVLVFLLATFCIFQTPTRVIGYGLGAFISLAGPSFLTRCL